MMRNDQRSSKNMFSLTGWLFADMFLAIMMIFLVASTVGKYSPPVKQHVTQIVGINPNPRSISIKVDIPPLLSPGDSDAKRSVRDQVTRKMHITQTTQVGMVLTFSCGLDDGTDTAISNAVNDALRVLPAFNKATFRGLIDRSCTPGTVNLESYYFTLHAGS